MRNILPLIILLSVTSLFAQPRTRFEVSGGKQTSTYDETIAWWRQADALSPVVKMMEMGPSDAGKPLHLVLVSADKEFSIPVLKGKGRAILLINNGIHPGEPDGIDASMLLVKDIIQKKVALPANVVLAFIPVYNIGGALNRSKYFRVDQNGPEEGGSRGNSQNLDLNRDFIKMDSKEAVSFARIFHLLDPDVFIDNHVSNGADYQHVMTLIETQHSRLGGDMGRFLNKEFTPALYASMKKKGFDLVPYVNHFGESPDNGWPEFWDSPRYSSGYAALWSTFAFVPETHMLKPYPQRVKATYDLMQSFIDFTSLNSTRIRQLRQEARAAQMVQTSFPLLWKLDRTRSQEILFKGYTAGRKTSEVSGLPRLFYDREKPYEIRVPFYNAYVDTVSVTKPKAYIIPQGWWKVLERLQVNGIPMRRLSRDTTIEVEAYRIEGSSTSVRPFEGHRLNTNVRTSRSMVTMTFRKGDFYIPMTSKANRFLIEVLEPRAEDSYFIWNFFDPILGQKEGFSDYVFEETAAAFLRSAPEVKAKLEERKRADSSFAKNGAAQLDFVFKASPYYEPGHLQYPVFRVL